MRLGKTENQRTPDQTMIWGDSYAYFPSDSHGITPPETPVDTMGDFDKIIPRIGLKASIGAGCVP